MVAGRTSRASRASNFGEAGETLPAIPDQLKALGLKSIPEDGLASLGMSHDAAYEITLCVTDTKVCIAMRPSGSVLSMS